MSSSFGSVESLKPNSSLDDLKRRIFYTLFILIIYRFCTYVPLPGIDAQNMEGGEF